MDDETTVVERTRGCGGELVLRRRGADFEIIENGVLLMDTRGGRSERLLVRVAIEAMPAPGRIVIAGLGVGFSLTEALADPRVGQVHVVEREEAVLRWNRGPLASVHGNALDDERVHVHQADIVGWLAQAPSSAFDAVCLDVDNGPDWLVTPSNAELYGDAGIARVARVLAPDGVLTIWSAARAPELEARLRRHFGVVRTVPVPVDRGEPDVVLVATLPPGRGPVG